MATRGLSEEDVADFKEAFDNFDQDRNGSIDNKELATVLRSLGYTPTPAQLQKLMDKVRAALRLLIGHEPRPTGTLRVESGRVKRCSIPHVLDWDGSGGFRNSRVGSGRVGSGYPGLTQPSEVTRPVNNQGCY